MDFGLYLPAKEALATARKPRGPLDRQASCEQRLERRATRQLDFGIEIGFLNHRGQEVCHEAKTG